MPEPLPIPAELMPEPPGVASVDSLLAYFDENDLLPQAIPLQVESQEDDPGRPRWRVEDDNAAEWAMRKLAETSRLLRNLTEQRAEWVDRIDSWHRQAAKPLERREAFFTFHLEDYALRRREADPTKRTLVLPSGRVRTTSRTGAVQ